MANCTMDSGGGNGKAPKKNPNAKPSVDMGSGPDNHFCGNCGHIVMANVFPRQISNMAIQCGACGAYNTPT